MPALSSNGCLELYAERFECSHQKVTPEGHYSHEPTPNTGYVLGGGPQLTPWVAAGPWAKPVPRRRYKLVPAHQRPA